MGVVAVTVGGVMSTGPPPIGIALWTSGRVSHAAAVLNVRRCQPPVPSMNTRRISGFCAFAEEGGHWSPLSEVLVAAKTLPAGSAVRDLTLTWLSAQPVPDRAVLL